MAISPQTGSRHWLRFAAGVICAWALVVGLIVLVVVPHTPRTATGWLVLLIAGPPIYIALGWLVECVIVPRLPSFSPKRYSLAWFGMMAIGVLVGSAFLALAIWISLLLGR